MSSAFGDLLGDADQFCQLIPQNYCIKYKKSFRCHGLQHDGWSIFRVVGGKNHCAERYGIKGRELWNSDMTEKKTAGKNNRQ